MVKTSNFNKNIFNFLRQWYILIVLCIIYIPLLIIVFISFNPSTNRGNISLNFTTPTFDNYLNLWKDNTFLNGLLNSLLLSVIVVPMCLFIGIITVFGLYDANKFSKFGTLLISNFSIFNPEIITGVSLLILFSSTWVSLGFNFGFFTVLLSHISFCTPYAIIIFYPKIEKMNKNLIFASYDVGSSKIRTFFHVIIPYLKDAILSASAIVLSTSFDDFIITNLVNGSFQTIGTSIYMTRKGIKVWVVTFGSIIILTAIIILVISSILIRLRSNKRKMYEKIY